MEMRAREWTQGELSKVIETSKKVGKITEANSHTTRTGIKDGFTDNWRSKVSAFITKKTRGKTADRQKKVDAFIATGGEGTLPDKNTSPVWRLKGTCPYRYDLRVILIILDQTSILLVTHQ